MNKNLLFTFSILCFGLGQTFSQNHRLVLNDSLKGFDETSLTQKALANNVGQEELSMYLAANRRHYIKEKYHLNSPSIAYDQIAKLATAACVNEDFEEGSLTTTVPGTINITTTNAINGWLATGSSNSSGGSNGNCINAYSYGLPNPIQLIAPGPAGLTDAIIGAGYKIYSVFGDTTVTYPAAAAMDPFNHYGDWFAKINNQTNGSSVNRLTKTINVTPSNVYFNFAVLVVVEGSHGCCDGGAVSIIFKDCLGNMLATAQQFSIAAAPGCATSSSLTILTSTVNPTWKYNQWANSSIDLSLWLGQCVTAEFTAFDCTYTGHAGYAYIDAQCAPMIVNGINSISNHTYYKVYPNPNAGQFMIDIAKEIENGEIELRNVLGQIVHKQIVKQGSNSIKTESLAKGIYNYSILNNKEVVSVGKIVIE